MKKIFAVLMCVVLLLSLGACKKDSYKAGEFKDGVYTNSRLGFKITTQKGDTVYTGEDVKDSNHYIVNVNYAKNRGATSGFKCDMVIEAVFGELLVLSEKNVSNLDMDGFAKKVESELKAGLLSYSISENADVTIDNVTFRHIVGESSINKVEYYILEDEDRFTYIYFFSGNHTSGISEKFRSYISGI